MDFEPAPAGVVGAALLAHRGADHEVVMPAANLFHGCMQNAFSFTPIAAGAHTLPYSETSAVGAYILFTRGPRWCRLSTLTSPYLSERQLVSDST